MPAPPALMRRPSSRSSRARRRGRLSGGLALTGWGGGRSAQQRLLPNPAIWLRFRFTPDDPNSPAAEDWFVSSLPSATYNNWFQLSEGYKVPEQGTLEVSVGSDDPALQGYFDDLRLEHTGGLIVQEQHQYAYGSPLTGLNYVVGTKRYRHGYQGQYAEQDPETGYESFELRLYNARIGRWTSYDPYGQFSSPYVGMGNNPVSGVDPDGGFAVDPFISIMKHAGGLIKGLPMINVNFAALAPIGAAIGRGAAAAGPVALQLGVAGLRTFLSSSSETRQGPNTSAIYNNETDAYKRMLSLQGSLKLEMGGALVEGKNGDKKVVIFRYGMNTYTGAMQMPSPEEQTQTFRRGKTQLTVNGIPYKIVGLIHTHPYADADGYEGPSGVTNGTVNSAGGAQRNDMVAYNESGKIPSFVIGLTQVSKLNPQKPFFMSYGKNQHQIMTTKELLDGRSLFPYVK